MQTLRYCIVLIASPSPLTSRTALPPPPIPGSPTTPNAAMASLVILSCNHGLPATDTEAAEVHALHPGSQLLVDPSAEQAAAAVGPHDCVHFCGHSDPRLGQDRVLVWCKNGGLEAVAAATLVEMLRGKRLVVLNGCCSDELGGALLRAGVQHVVCWETKLFDPAGALFGVGFWRVMVGHETDGEAEFRAAVRTAFEAGRTAVLSATRPQPSALDVGDGRRRAASVPTYALVDPSAGASTSQGEIAAGVPLLLLCPPSDVRYSGAARPLPALGRTRSALCGSRSWTLPAPPWQLRRRPRSAAPPDSVRRPSPPGAPTTHACGVALPTPSSGWRSAKSGQRSRCFAASRRGSAKS